MPRVPACFCIELRGAFTTVLHRDVSTSTASRQWKEQAVAHASHGTTSHRGHWRRGLKTRILGFQPLISWFLPNNQNTSCLGCPDTGDRQQVGWSQVTLFGSTRSTSVSAKGAGHFFTSRLLGPRETSPPNTRLIHTSYMHIYIYILFCNFIYKTYINISLCTYHTPRLGVVSGLTPHSQVAGVMTCPEQGNQRPCAAFFVCTRREGHGNIGLSSDPHSFHVLFSFQKPKPFQPSIIFRVIGLAGAVAIEA